MRTLSVQQMPNGFEVETPSFGFWFKAGIAFTLGASTIGILLAWTAWIMTGLALASLWSIARH